MDYNNNTQWLQLTINNEQWIMTMNNNDTNHEWEWTLKTMTMKNHNSALQCTTIVIMKILLQSMQFHG